MLKEDERVAYQAAFNTFDWFVKTSIYCVNCPKIVHDNGCPGQIMVGWPTEACKMWWGELGWTRLILRLILSNTLLTICTIFALIRNAETTDTMVIGPPCNIGFSYQTSQRSQVSRVALWKYVKSKSTLSKSVSEWQGHLLSSFGQLKIISYVPYRQIEVKRFVKGRGW